jgi:serine/threonine protein kinase
MSNAWANFRQWDEAWESVRDLPGGGQGSAKQVKSRADGYLGFLKVLNRQGDPERRSRFFREATAYDTFKHPGIPTLAESNSHFHDDLGYQLYIVTEYVDGATLSESIGQNGSPSFESSLRLSDKLLEIVVHLHSQDWVHRDIKPDNIILRQTLLEHPVLVDFGLSFKDNLPFNSHTEHEQEIGNRFLRLPELSSGSTSKRDPRSDIAFLGGIFFYVLTEIYPFTLLDSDGRMPHQRLKAVTKLKKTSGDAFLDLQHFFDKCFSQKLSGRFSSAEAMKAELQTLITRPPPKVALTTEQQLAKIATKLDSEANRNLAKLKILYDRAMAVIKDAHSNIARSFAPTYLPYQSGYVNFTGGLRNILGFAHFATHDHRFAPQFLISVIGEEIVITVDGVPFYRTEVDAPIFEDQLRSRVLKLYIEGMSRLIESPLPSS